MHQRFCDAAANLDAKTCGLLGSNFKFGAKKLWRHASTVQSSVVATPPPAAGRGLLLLSCSSPGCCTLLLCVRMKLEHVCAVGSCQGARRFGLVKV